MYLGFLEGVKLKNIMGKAIFVRQTKRIGSFCLTLILIVTLSVNNCRFMIEKFPEKQVPMILDFLKGIAANNNRPWFLSHREEYNEVRTLFEAIASQFIARLSEIDETVRFLSVKDCTYRFYRVSRLINAIWGYTWQPKARNRIMADTICILNLGIVCLQ